MSEDLSENNVSPKPEAKAYRNARTKTGEMVTRWLVVPVILATFILIIMHSKTAIFYQIAAWVYLLIAGSFVFFIWDTKNIPHTIRFEKEQMVVLTRGSEDSVRWDEIDDILWKKVVHKRAVVGLYLKDGEQRWFRTIHPDLAKSIEDRWKKI